jgi:hypothetical protein
VFVSDVFFFFVTAPIVTKFLQKDPVASRLYGDSSDAARKLPFEDAKKLELDVPWMSSKLRLKCDC